MSGDAQSLLPAQDGSKQLEQQRGRALCFAQAVSVKALLVNECGSVLLGVHLLGDWEEAKPNRNLPTLLGWWEHHANEKWGSRERILPMYHLPRVVTQCGAALDGEC